MATESLPTKAIKRMVIVNDDSHLNELLCEIFEEVGFSCQTSLDGCDGLRAVEAQTEPFVLLLNYFMPCMTGHDVLRVLETKPHILNLARTIFFSSTLAGTGDLKNLLARLNIPFLPVPFDYDQVMTYVRRVSE